MLLSNQNTHSQSIAQPFIVHENDRFWTKFLVMFHFILQNKVTFLFSLKNCESDVIVNLLFYSFAKNSFES